MNKLLTGALVCSFLAAQPIPLSAYEITGTGQLAKEQDGEVMPLSNLTRSSTVYVGGCNVTGTIIYDASTGKIGNATLSCSPAEKLLSWSKSISVNKLSCTFTVSVLDITLTPVTRSFTVNSPGPM